MDIKITKKIKKIQKFSFHPKRNILKKMLKCWYMNLINGHQNYQKINKKIQKFSFHSKRNILKKMLKCWYMN